MNSSEVESDPENNYDIIDRTGYDEKKEQPSFMDIEYMMTEMNLSDSSSDSNSDEENQSELENEYNSDFDAEQEDDYDSYSDDDSSSSIPFLFMKLSVYRCWRSNGWKRETKTARNPAHRRR